MNALSKVRSIAMCVALLVGGLTVAARADEDKPPVVIREVVVSGGGAQTQPAATQIVWATRNVPATQATQPTTQATTQASQPATASADTLDGCRELHMKGEYSAAAESYRKLVDKHRLAASIGLAEALSIEGKHADAIAALKAAAADGDKQAEWHVAMAEQLDLTGRYEDALQHAARANELRPDWAPAILAHGLALETVGKKQEASAVYKTMEKALANNASRKDARSLVALGRIMDRHGILGGKKASDQAQNILHNYLQEAYLTVDKNHWPANVAAGMFLLSNYRPNQAAAEFQLAAKVNKRIPDVFVGMGAITLRGMRFEQCLAAADKALEINPNHADAHLLKAFCMMQWRKFDEAREMLQKVFQSNPNHMEALSLMAALHVRQGDADQAQPYIEKVRKVNPKYHGLPNMIGEVLAAGRQFKEAEPYYRQAVELAPELAEPLTNLGLLYMQTGEEAKARDILQQAAKINDFREDVANYLDLLNELLDPNIYLVKETEHFVVKVNAQYDKVLLDQVAEYLETMHQEIVLDYGYTPPEKTIVEIFPSGPKFSVRLSGRGWVPTVGACTGKVIALAAPGSQRENSSTYNWAVVLRHEYTHAVTLAQTNNRIPHWFTEACAVFQQPDRRAYRYVTLLVNATRMGQLFSVKDLDWGFIRPKRPTDRPLAYAQSEWMLEYIISRKGYHPTVTDLLAGFRDGLTQAEVLQKVLGVTEDQFDTEFRQWAKEQVREWRFDPEPPPDLQKAEQAAKERPQDAAAQAEHAIALYNARQLKPAAEAARKALDIDPNQPKALAVVAFALLAEKKYDEAIGMARQLEQADHTSIHAPRILAQCYLEKRSWAEAIAALELFKQRQPLDQFSYAELAKLYTALGQPDRALPNLLELHRRTMNDHRYARQIADTYRSLNQDDNALEFYRQVIYINPYEVTTYESMAAIHLKAGRNDEALASAERMTMVEPESADAWTKRAMVEYRVGKKADDAVLLKRARASAEAAVKINPDSQAKQVLELIERVSPAQPEPTSEPTTTPATAPATAEAT